MATVHWAQTALASEIWERAGPVVPTGKNNSGLVSRQSAWLRHSYEAFVRAIVLAKDTVYLEM